MEMVRMPTPGPNQSKSANGELRIAALDGIRGFMIILVLFSHFFAEITNGFPSLGFGWLAVNMFFVLSGFLIGRLIIERKESENFFTVFIMRRDLQDHSVLHDQHSDHFRHALDFSRRTVGQIPYRVSSLVLSYVHSKHFHGRHK
jgi:hypothetical protein